MTKERAKQMVNRVFLKLGDYGVDMADLEDPDDALMGIILESIDAVSETKWAKIAGAEDNAD